MAAGKAFARLLLAPAWSPAHGRSAARVWVRHSSSLWRQVPLYKKEAAGRYRIAKTQPKPTMPVRVEGVTGVVDSPFRHGVLLPDGYFIPWLGRPHLQFVEFWRRMVGEWDGLMAERKRQGKQEWFCCPRCDGFLKMRQRQQDFDENVMEDLWHCPTAECAIDAARINKRGGVSRVEVLEGVISDVTWQQGLRHQAAARSMVDFSVQTLAVDALRRAKSAAGEDWRQYLINIAVRQQTETPPPKCPSC